MYEGISDEQYTHAQKVWDTFSIKTMGRYHDLYLKSDILLLADIFENFRETCLQYYKLDPAHYFTSPGLSWDAMLKMTSIKLELMTLMWTCSSLLRKVCAGGISCIVHRHEVANNKYMSDYDESKLSKYIMYLDPNNLYRYAMSQCLPTGGFTWLTDKQLPEVKKKNILPDSKKGYIFEVDLDYPEELQSLHNDYPLAAEKMCVTKEMLSPYCKMLQEKFGITIGQVEKLIPTLSSTKKKCVAL